jgi:hypothetical protein
VVDAVSARCFPGDEGRPFRSRPAALALALRIHSIADRLMEVRNSRTMRKPTNRDPSKSLAFFVSEKCGSARQSRISGITTGTKTSSSQRPTSSIDSLPKALMLKAENGLHPSLNSRHSGGADARSADERSSLVKPLSLSVCRVDSSRDRTPRPGLRQPREDGPAARKYEFPLTTCRKAPSEAGESDSMICPHGNSYPLAVR